MLILRNDGKYNSCVDDNDKAIIPEIILNSDDTIRKDPFFYKCDGGLCFDYIKEIWKSKSVY